MDVPPSDYGDAFDAAIYSWWYYLTFLFPAAVYAVPAIRRWRHVLWLVPVAFMASCVGYFVYWRSIDYALMAYYEKTGYFNTADTWYVFMPIFRGLPNVIVATFACTLCAWSISRRRLPGKQLEVTTSTKTEYRPRSIQSDNPYEPPHDT